MFRTLALGWGLVLWGFSPLSILAQQQGLDDDLIPQLTLTAASTRHGRIDVIKFDSKGAELELLVADPKAVMEPAWSPDGRLLAVVAFRTGVGQIFVMDRDTRSVINLTKTESYERLPAWSPDGTQLAFTSNRSGNQDILVMDADGSNVVNLTSHEGYDADPAWSPDGKKIAFASRRDGRPFRLFVMNSDGSNQRPLFEEDLNGWLLPDWSPGGKQIAVGKFESGSVQLYILDIESNALQPVTAMPGLNVYPRWSPDGRFISYAYFDAPPLSYAPGMPVDAAVAGGDLMIYEVATGDHRFVLKDELPYWGPRASWQTRGPAPDAE
ncbi:MAG: hypothetical protein KY475_05585 [Planctomycetes bacterium]|nr:hypothetical protein [Planctomycetota bacterium]